MKTSVYEGRAELHFVVEHQMRAVLEGREMHPVYSTFWLSYHAEVAARRAIEPYFDEDENAVGASLTLVHEAMAPIGAQLRVVACVQEVRLLSEGAVIVCSVEAFARYGKQEERIAHGTQTQVSLPQASIDKRVHEAYQRLAETA
jgi:predicted thioesterase